MALTDNQQILSDDVLNQMQANRFNSARFKRFRRLLRIEERAELVNDVVDKSINEEKGGYGIAFEVKKKYGVSIILMFQFIVLVFKILEIIKDRRDKEENNG